MFGVDKVVRFEVDKSAEDGCVGACSGFARIETAKRDKETKKLLHRDAIYEALGTNCRYAFPSSRIPEDFW